MDKAGFFKLSLDVLFYSGASRILRSLLGGRGAIFMLHHICPGGGSEVGFAPNAGLEITPEYLDAVIGRVTALGYDLLSLEEAVDRLKGREAHQKPFAVFTIDDGYLDNLVHALPVFRRRNCPFTIFVSPSIIDGNCELWWRGLEAVIASAEHIEVSINDQDVRLAAGTVAEKYAALFDAGSGPASLDPPTLLSLWPRS
jgi:peptidoglycan/xylan/chitin deacetylase (PgdA/CDA1 family)